MQPKNDIHFLLRGAHPDCISCFFISSSIVLDCISRTCQRFYYYYINFSIVHDCVHTLCKDIANTSLFRDLFMSIFTNCSSPKVHEFNSRTYKNTVHELFLKGLKRSWVHELFHELNFARADWSLDWRCPCFRKVFQFFQISSGKLGRVAVTWLDP